MSLSASTQTLGPYHLIRPLAHGSFAVIHLAMREGARELVALKELQHHTFGDPDSERRFRREAHLCALLDHTNVCRLLDAGADRDRFYIAFEYVPGVSLLRLMQRLRERDERLPHEVAVQIIAQTLDGLEHMHSRRGPDGNPLHLIHRDLKPSNIMLRFDGVVKIIDFGVAAARVDTHRTEAGRAMGTMAYMSPEQLRAEPLDHRSDLYAVGVILYELLTDRRLVDVNGYVELIDAVLHTKPPPLPSDIPDALEHVLNRALSKDRRQRWSN
ncbi:MAG: serine/threonine-protein kinase, partial [Myxococcota bacterium]